MNKKIGLFLLVLLLCAASAGKLYAYSASVSDFTGLQSAITSSTNTTNTISITTNTIVFQNTISTVSKNISFSGQSGGSVFDLNGSYVSFSTSNLSFANISFRNGATSGIRVGVGGGVSLNFSTAVFSGAIDFTNNSGFGGGLYINSSSVTFTDNVNFSSNASNSTYPGYLYDGGGFYAKNSKLTFAKEVVFSSNNASRGAGFAADGSNISFLDKVYFMDAVYGGGFYASYSTVTFSKDVVFLNNAGGGVGGCEAYIANIIFGGKTDFIDNGNSAFYTYSSTVTFKNTVNFINNYCTYNGGSAITATGFSSIVFEQDANFLNNSGGSVNSVVYAWNGPNSIDFKGKVLCKENNGGFYAQDNAKVIFEKDADFINNNADAIHAKNSNISFIGTASFVENWYGFKAEGSTLTLNTVYSSGNATGFSLSSSTLSLGNSTFEYNAYGSVLNYSSATFRNTAVFSNNGSRNYYYNNYYNTGGALSLVNSTAAFQDNVTISNNVAGLGGGFYLKQSSATFFGYFTSIHDNMALDGGGIYLDNSFLILSQGFTRWVYHENNHADRDGGALFFNNSDIIFPDTSVEYFNYNTAGGSGGGIMSKHSNIYYGANPDFKENSAYLNGGAICAEDSDFSFKIGGRFYSNTAQTGNGGAICSNNSTFYFDFAGEFYNNTSYLNGGAIYLENSVLPFTWGETFTGNSCLTGSGGAMYVYKSSATSDNALISFESNKAGTNGGAISAKQSVIDLKIGGNFLNNTAVSGYGGAVYLDSVTFSISASSNDFIFSGNTDSSGGNDIYIAEQSILKFDSSSNTISLSGGIVTSRTTAAYMSELYKYGTGSLYLGGKNYLSFNQFVINSGSVQIAADAKYDIINLTIAANSELNISNGSADNIKLLNLNSQGTLVMDAKDTIYATHASIGGKVTINLGDIRPVRSGSYAVITSENNFTGSAIVTLSSFSLNRITSITRFQSSNEIGYTADISRLDAIQGLSSNQAQTASSIDYMFGTATGARLDKINYIDGLPVNLKKAALTDISGSFIANVIKTGVTNADRNAIYGHMDNAYKGLWAEGYGEGSALTKDVNSSADFNAGTYGIEAGWDIINVKNILSGFSINYANSNYTQGQNKGDMANIELNIYGGYFINKWNFKGRLRGGYQSYNTTRYMEIIDETASGKFNGLSFGANAQAEYIVPVADNVYLSPFFGLEIGMLQYDSFQESGSNFNLNVEGGNYTMSKANLGANFKGKANAFNWYAGAGLSCFLNGTQGKFNASLDGHNTENISGAEQGALMFNVSLGGEYLVRKIISIHADMNAGAGSGISLYKGALGITYKLGK